MPPARVTVTLPLERVQVPLSHLRKLPFVAPIVPELPAV